MFGDKMLLSHVQIKNFRGIEDLSISLDDVSVLIGENNSGKSSVLDAIRFCLSETASRNQVVFSPYDYHLKEGSEDPVDSPPIEIVLSFTEQYEGQWPQQQTEQLQPVEIVRNDGLTSYRLRMQSYFDKSENKFRSELNFIDADGEPLIRPNQLNAVNRLKAFIPTFYLSSIRDAAKEFKVQSKFWRPFATDIKLTESEKRELENDLLELNTKIVIKHESFENVKEKLQNVARLMGLESEAPISIDALPAKIRDILSRTRVNLESITGAKIPIEMHGSGTQSVAVICLFEAFIQLRSEQINSDFSEPLLALEEPEAHLHPSAAKTLGNMIQKIRGQKIISTHSGELLASIPITKIRRLQKKKGKITVYQLQKDTLNENEKIEINYLLRNKRDNIMFARCWLFVEGKTETIILQECARAMNYDLFNEGVNIVEISQTNISVLIRLAIDFGIEWFVLADGDDAGNKYVKFATNLLNKTLSEDHIFQFKYKDIETYLCNNGFGTIYIDTVSNQEAKKIGLELPPNPNQWSQVLKCQQSKTKTRNAEIIANQILKNGNDEVPKELKEVIRKTISLARNVL